MERVVLDACSLILITKISIKEFIINNFSEIIISKAVEKEVLTDTNKYPESIKIKRNLDSKRLKLKSVLVKPLSKNLGLGESESIALAKTEQILLITDDKIPLRIALNSGLKVKTTETLLIFLLEKKIIDFQQFIEKLNELNNIKTLKSEIFQFLLNEAEKYK